MNYIISNIGDLANKHLSENSNLRFFGQTSKGIFLLSPSNKIIFISTELFMGPYTINFNNANKQIPICSKETKILFQNNQIQFENPSFTLTKNQHTKIYTPNMSCTYSFEKIIKNITAILQNIETTVNPYLSTTIQLLSPEQEIANVQDQQIKLFGEIKKALQQNSENNLLEALSKLIGVGTGLTPSGDDFITGIILSETIIKNKAFSENFINSLIKEAQQKTTLISANLIEAAFQRKADERILNSIKQICADDFPNISAINQLKTWGNSSGIDTLAGIILSSQISL